MPRKPLSKHVLSLIFNAPLLDDVEAAFDDVAALVVLGVEERWASTG